MLAILIVILVLIWAAVVWSIYSNFLVFYSNFSETENYHRAYYASISALERAELVTKQREPWYVWSGWFIMWEWTWSTNNSDWWSDASLPDFSYYWDNKEDTTVFRSINSRTNRIPTTWEWDVEWMLATWDSNNYNMMDYENAEVFLMRSDKSEGRPYNDWVLGYPSNIEDIKWEIRLPKLLKESDSFGLLDTGTSLVWQPWSMPADDAMVDWQIRWNYGGDKPFTIFSTQSVVFGGNSAKIDANKDTVFRESDINNTLNFNFWDNGRSPFGNHSTRWLYSITVVGENESDIKDKGNYRWVFGDDNISQIRFSLLNLLQWGGKNVYPFLEYYIDFWDVQVPDKYFNINAEWAYKDYKVNMIIKKPTLKETVFWSFTSMF